MAFLKDLVLKVQSMNSGYDYRELYNKTSVVGLLASDTSGIN